MASSELWTALQWFGVSLGLGGGVLNSRQQIGGFHLWIASDIVLIAVNAHAQLWGQALLFVLYMIICINGIRTWSGK